MAINIFSGGAAKAAKQPRVSSAAERAQATTSAIAGPAVASDSGSTAVKSTGVLGKIGSFIGNAANVLGNILPGPAGMIAKAVGSITSANDPEWWQHVPGDGLTVNSPLTPIPEGFSSPTAISGTIPLLNMRPTFLNFKSSLYDSVISADTVMRVSDRMCTQYIMPSVRKVTNAVVMQNATVYAQVFECQATMYALWRQLKKYDYFIKHGYTFIPNTNDPAFPIFQVGNAAWLQSTITRLEEYLHSHVRLPHTLCEYLTWRYGRMFRMNNSAKAGFVSYDVKSMTETIAAYESHIENIQNYLSSTDQIQKAVSDLYNAYDAHDQEVLITDASMIMFDSKEFCLRTNLDIYGTTYSRNPWRSVDENPIIIDSNLDNPTVFMASTVSVIYDNSLQQLPLFPVEQANLYIARSASTQDFFQYYLPTDTNGTSAQASTGWLPVPGSTTWLTLTVQPAIIGGKEAYTAFDTVGSFFDTIHMVEACKAADFYNVGIFYLAKINNSSAAGALALVDQTSLSMDMGSVPDIVIANEQVLAFANLVCEDARNAETYKSIEKRAAKDIANFVENNEVAAISK